jgi:hypothetical protein
MKTNNLPLPLQLTKPVLLAGDLDTQFREGLSQYDPKTQLCSGTHSNAKSNSRSRNLLNGIVIDDATADFVVDDVIA